MAERTIVVCDVCGKPAVETATIKVSRGNFAKDLCADHVTQLIAGARKPRPGRPRKLAEAASPSRRRGRPRSSGRKTAGRKTAARKQAGRRKAQTSSAS
jgi:hypothetical protein